MPQSKKWVSCWRYHSMREALGTSNPTRRHRPVELISHRAIGGRQPAAIPPWIVSVQGHIGSPFYRVACMASRLCFLWHNRVVVRVINCLGRRICRKCRACTNRMALVQCFFPICITGVPFNANKNVLTPWWATPCSFIDKVPIHSPTRLNPENDNYPTIPHAVCSREL
ncbi:hypothetical protein PIB30_028061 [Stylosanthes scabra]|uniref:Uncharacterized protein n=1 Tax=Stylosanthes scabra TaxID=79078 RepID=A0ABU6RBC1_9FABA|nr:hypothetical protein [Stylosanthes scabra]